MADPVSDGGIPTVATIVMMWIHTHYSVLADRVKWEVVGKFRHKVHMAAVLADCRMALIGLIGNVEAS